MVGCVPVATILCPLAFERRSLQRLLADVPLRFEQCGPGESGIVRFFETHQISNVPQPLILAGLAGSVSEALRVGDAIIVNEVCDDSGTQWRPTWLPHHAGAASHTISSTPAILRTRQERLTFASEHHVDLADQESVPFARMASAAAIQWGIVRGISDDLSTSLPHRVDRWVNCSGRTRAFVCARDLALHPSDIPHMIELARNSRLAMQRVAALLRLSALNQKQPGASSL